MHYSSKADSPGEYIYYPGWAALVVFSPEIYNPGFNSSLIYYVKLTCVENTTGHHMVNAMETNCLKGSEIQIGTVCSSLFFFFFFLTSELPYSGGR